MSQYSHLSDPDPELLECLAAAAASGIKGPDLSGATPAHTLREMNAQAITQIAESARVDLPDESKYAVADHTLPVQDGEITIRTIVPTPVAGEDSTLGFPILVWFHGGGWVLGNIHMDDFRLRRLSVQHRLSVVNVEYRLAPEHPFPIPLNDCYAAVRWAVTNAFKIHGALDKGFLLGGASAGGNLTAAITHRTLRDPFFEKNKITGQILQMPGLVHPSAYPDKYRSELLSYNQNKDAPVLPKVAIETFYRWYGGSPSDPDLSPLLYLLQQDSKDVRIPPAFFQVCGLDPLRDTGLLYERLLREQGVPTKLNVYPGLPHGFSYSFPQLSGSKKWADDVDKGVAWILKTGY